MNIPRVFFPYKILTTNIYIICKKTIHHIKTVLKTKKFELIEILDKKNKIYIGTIKHLSKRKIKVKILSKKKKKEKNLTQLHMGQVICKNKKMNFSIQKSTELGVKIITPLFSERCIIKIKKKRMEKKVKKWKKIAISSMKQSKSIFLPIINSPISIEDWCKKKKKDQIGILFTPQSSNKINLFSKNFFTSFKDCFFLIGPEGGISKKERKMLLKKYNFVSISLGKNILRTETAVIAAITLLQYKIGHF